MMKQWARMYNTPLVTHQSVLATTHAGPQGQAPTTGRDINFAGSFVKDSDFESKHDNSRMVPSSVSPPPSPDDAAVPRLSRGAMVDENNMLLQHRDLPSWTPLVVSDSEGGTMDELPLEDSKAPLSNARKTLSRKRQQSPDQGPPIAMPRREVQQASSRTPTVCSESRDPRGPRSLQEILQATFTANGSYNVSPPVASIDSEGSSTDVQTVIYGKQRRRIQNARRSTSQEGSEAIAVVDAPIFNAITAIPNIAPRKAGPAVPYESMQNVIDAALDTRVAKINRRSRRHTTKYDTNAKSQDGSSGTKCFPFEDAIFDFDVSTSAHRPELASVKDEHRVLPRKFTQIQNGVQAAALPQQPRGEKFNERLDAMFGSTDTSHSPNGLITRATADSASIPVPVRDVAASKEHSPVPSSDSGASVDTSLSQSTKATSLSGRVDVSQKRVYTESHLGDEPIRKKHKIEIAEDQVSKWIAGLQRLVKGKTKIGHKGMEDLSIVLAEIESVYPHLDSELALVTCLQDVLKQLAQLEHIPFKDEYNLRRRTDDIIAEWPSAKVHLTN